MYCPNCSQQQISEETKFCSRCGLPLGLVSEILANGGFLPQLDELYKDKKFFTRRNGILFGLFWFMFFVLVLTPFGGITGAPKEFIATMALLGVMGSLIIFAASFTILKKESKPLNSPSQNKETDNIKYLNGQNQTMALPPQQSIPTSTYAPPTQGNWRDTKDLIQPSVTEGTTKLLSENK